MDRSPTDELLLYCLRGVPNEAVDCRLETLSSADWDVLIQESGRHAVAPLLYHRLRTLHSHIHIPADVMARLRDIFLQSAARSTHMYHELAKVLVRLRHAKIPVIVLKGGHLAALVYGNTALRLMGDVDVLVCEDDVMRVEAALLGMGYAPTECSRQIARDNCHFVYELPNNKLCVEVHWKFLPSMYRLQVDMQEQWERSRQALIAGVWVSVLCPEDLLLHLCLHTSAKHLFAVGLRDLSDVTETIRYHGDEIDWTQVQRRSEKSGGAKCVYLTFRLARELLGASVPPDLMESLKPRDFDERFMELAMERIFAFEQWNADGLLLGPSIAELWGSERLVTKVILCLRKAFPLPEVMARKYPAPSDSMRIYLYYPLHIKDLLLGHGRQLWRLLRGDEEMRALAERENDISALRDWLTSP